MADQARAEKKTARRAVFVRDIAQMLRGSGVRRPCRRSVGPRSGLRPRTERRHGRRTPDLRYFFFDEDFRDFEELFFEELFLDGDFFALAFFDAAFFAGGTFPPSRRASDRPMAMAC